LNKKGYNESDTSVKSNSFVENSIPPNYRHPHKITMLESDTLPSLANISRLAWARFEHISELPRVPEFIAKEGSGRFDKQDTPIYNL
jgi:hypothetical protein